LHNTTIIKIKQLVKTNVIKHVPKPKEKLEHKGVERKLKNH
jgi:hypothetical protein